MSKYRWIIKTSDDLYSGSGPGRVYLSLHGLDAAMRETLISWTKALKQFQKGSEATGVLSIPEHLGTLQTGTLRSTSKWKVDWVSVTCLDEGDRRTWVAEVGKWDNDGKFPMLRFEEIEGPPPPSAESSGLDPADADGDDGGDDSSAEPDQPKENPKPEDRELAALQAALDEINSKLKVLELRRQVEMKKRLLEQTQQQNNMMGSSPEKAEEPAPPTPFITFELVAKKDGEKVPFTNAVLMLGGEVVVLPSVDFFIGDSPEDGFGLGGDPGKWYEIYPGRPPESMGLDSGVGILIFDGKTGHAIDPHTLSVLFGADWRKTVYSAQMEENDT